MVNARILKSLNKIYYEKKDNSSVKVESENLDLETDSNITINVSEGIKLKILENSNASNLYRFLEVNLEKNSNLAYSQLILDSLMNISKVNLKENSVYVLKSAYFANNKQMYINNTANHIGKSSESNMQINGASRNNSKVIADGLVRIENQAPESSGHQQLSGIILDETSSILSEPILEIKNNNVRCSHGSSISQVKDEINFYMNSRGLSKDEIVNLIVTGYFNLAVSLVESEHKGCEDLVSSLFTQS